MNTSTSQIQDIILRSIENANKARNPDELIDCSPDAQLYGRGSPLDSFGLVGLLFDIEDELRNEGIEISLSSERAMSQSQSPFRSVPALVAYISETIEDPS